MFLSETDLTGLTGRQRNHARARVLNALGIVFKQRPDGSIAVLSQHVERTLDPEPKQRKAKAWTPPWES